MIGNNDVNAIESEVGQNGLCQQLKEILEAYFAEHSNMSINALAMRSNVGATTLRRIMNLSIKGDPSPHTVLNIVSAVTKEKKLGQILKNTNGPVGELLNECFSAYVEQETTHTYNPTLNQILADKVCYFIYKLAANRTGVTKETVLEMYGRMGVEKIYEMVKLGHLEKKENVFHAKEKNFSMDIMEVRPHLPELIKFYKPEELDQGRNLFYTLSESMSAEGIKKIKEIQREAVRKTFEIMNAAEFAGDIPYFTIQACDTLSLSEVNGVLQ